MTRSTIPGRPIALLFLAEFGSGLGVMLFLAGLDTVKSLLSFFIAYLAKNPAHVASRERVVAHERHAIRGEHPADDVE